METKFQMEGHYRRKSYKENDKGEIKRVTAYIHVNDGFHDLTKTRFLVVFFGENAKKIMKVRNGSFLSIEGRIFKSNYRNETYIFVGDKFNVSVRL